MRLVARRFQIAQHRPAGLIMPAGLFRLGLGRRGDRAWFDDLEQSGFNGVVDPQAAEGDAARLAIIEQAVPASALPNRVRYSADRAELFSITAWTSTTHPAQGCQR